MGHVKIPKKTTVVGILTGVSVVALRFLSVGLINFDQAVVLILLGLLSIVTLVILVLCVLLVIEVLQSKKKGTNKGDNNKKAGGGGLNRWWPFL